LTSDPNIASIALYHLLPACLGCSISHCIRFPRSRIQRVTCTAIGFQKPSPSYFCLILVRCTETYLKKYIQQLH